MQIITRSDLIDEVTSARALRERYADGRVEQMVEAIADVRSAMHEARAISNVRSVSGLSDSKLWMRIGHVPLEIVVFMEQYVDPNFWRDPRLYYPWFEKHPEWKTSSYSRMR